LTLLHLLSEDRELEDYPDLSANREISMLKT
jgi:hypothetical protein